MVCTCSYSCVHGFPCVDMICVSLTFLKSWVRITHNDISVFWQKIFYLYSLPSNVIEDVDKQRKIKHILLKILEKEEIDIQVSPKLLNQLETPIINE